MHDMTTGYRNQDTENVPDTQYSTPMDLTPQDHPMLERDNDLSNEYCEETDTNHHFADLLEQFQLLKINSQA